MNNEPIGYVLLAVLVVCSVTVGMGAASILRSRGLISDSPLRYLPHFTLLLIIAVTPMTVDALPTLRRAATVLGGAAVIWLVAVWLSSHNPSWFSRKSHN